MYEYITGKLASKDPASAIVEAGGFGYRVHITAATFDRLPAAGSPVKLLLYKSFNAEQGLERLFGFLDDHERMLFLQLLEVQRIGPTVAMRLISNAGADVIIGAIAAADLATLKRVKGIGPKMAERLVVELQEPLSKLGMLVKTGVLPGASKDGSDLTAAGRDAVAALCNLGYRANEAEKAVAKALKDSPGADITALIRLALNNV